MTNTGLAIPVERIEQFIVAIRGEKVILDIHLASLYNVETRVLIQAVKRNRNRFPRDFMFQLTSEEFRSLKCQREATHRWGGRRSPPYAFTEQGVAMLSSVLHSERAIQVNVEIMRAFVRLRQILASHADLARKLDQLEKKYDAQFRVIFDAIRQLMRPAPEVPHKRIGYLTEMGKQT